MKRMNLIIKFLILIIFCPFSPSVIKSELLKENIISLDQLVRNSEYIMGPGDKLELRFSGQENFNGPVEILNDGTISLPIVGDIYITGMTKKLAENKIKKLLSTHLILPDVQILIKKPRKIKIAVIGEVINPGIYSLTEKETAYTIDKEFPFLPLENQGVPTLIDAIQKSGGFSKSADLTNILIKRKMSSAENNEKYKFAYSDLLKLVREGDFNQNPFLFDGDVITIRKNLKNKNKPMSFWGNLSPNKINVFVIGEVKDPGLKQIRSNSSLTKAILAAGGPINFRTKKTNIKIISENPSGEYLISEYKFNLKNKIINENIPNLNEGDVIFVGSSKLSKTGDALNLITRPFEGLYQTLRFIRLLEKKDD